MKKSKVRLMEELRPPFEELNNVKNEELIKLIRSLKMRLGRLRNLMEHPNYNSKGIKTCPSDLDMYKYDSDLLDMAIVSFVGRGGNYKYSTAELRDIAFNDKLIDISKITFVYGRFLESTEKAVVDLTGDDVKMQIGERDEVLPLDIGYTKEKFLYELENLHIGKWRKNYRTDRFGIHVCDGVEWSLAIKYKDGTKKNYYGCNAYPYNFDDLLELLCFDY